MSLTVEFLPLGPVQANCYIVTDEASGLSAVIDAGDFNESLKEKIKNKNVKYIMLTHGHYDHIIGVYDLKQFTGAEVLIHKADADCLFDEKRSLSYYSYMPGAQKPLTADRLLDEGDTVTLGETEFKVLHTPGHTSGSVCFADEKNRIMFTGDTLFCLTCGRTDLPTGDDYQMYESLKRLKELDGDYTVYTGHNRSTTLSAERVRNRYMRRI